MKALDVSFAASLITPQWCGDRKAEGYGLLIVNAWAGSQSPQGVEQALRLAREAGMLTAAYYVPHAFRAPDYHLAHAVAACGNEIDHLSFMAIDVEDIGSGDAMPAQWSVSHLMASVGLIQSEGLRPIFYSNKSQWDAAQLDDTLKDFGCWNADYSGVPDLTIRYPFGGWTVAKLHQYRGTTDLARVSVDLNLGDEVWLTEGTEEMQNIPTSLDKVWEVAVQLRQWGHDLGNADLTTQAEKLEAAVVAVKTVIQRDPSTP